MNEPPRVARVRRSRSGVHWVVVECPYCGSEHRHGAPKLGIRWSHCSSAGFFELGGSYELVPIEANSRQATDEPMDIISGRKEADTQPSQPSHRHIGNRAAIFG